MEAGWGLRMALMDQTFPGPVPAQKIPNGSMDL